MISTPQPWRLAPLLALFLALLAPLLQSAPPAQAEGPVHHVTWDSHSLMIDGQRLILDSGEFHYWRLPSRGEWLDRLQKMKAAGLNAVSIYFDWQYHSSAPGQYDFSGVRDIDYLLRLTDRLGLYVIARVGPYMNAEVDAGGLPGWVLTRTSFPRDQSWNGTAAQAQASALYEQYSKEWYDHLLPILAHHQVTGGGSVLLLSVENEYSEPQGSAAYMRQLYGIARQDGIDVPIFANDFYQRGDWKDVVDLYAFDSYPYGFACCHAWWDLHFRGIDTWEDTLRTKLGITTPLFVSELQGGSFDPWGGQGYEAIARTFGPDWLTLLDQTALAQGATLMNTYMFAGGTTWGYMSEPGVYTSYDYGAPISEAGILRPAYYSAHRLAMFLQSYGPALAGSSFAPNAAVPSAAGIVARARVDGASGQLFAFLRHGDSGAPIRTKLRLQLGARSLVVPQRQASFLTLPGRGGLIVTGNAAAGPLHLNYTTSQVLCDCVTSQGHYLVLYGPNGSAGETDFVLPGGATVVHDGGVGVSRANGELRLDYSHTPSPRTVSIATSAGTLRLLITTTARASRFWNVGDSLVSGPDEAWESDGGVELSNTQNHSIVVYGSPSRTSLRADGRVSAAPDPVMGETLLGRMAGPGAEPLPALSSWRFHAEAPEISTTFDDSAWAEANHQSTTNPNVPPSSTLLADDYGFHYGFVWYRGHFTATGSETGIAIAARQSYDVYLNGVRLGSADESLADPPHAYAQTRTFSFPPGLLRPHGDNTLAVLTESLGHDEGWLAGPLAQSPQGILSATLVGSTAPVAWRLQGDAGGEEPPDTARGLFNASGLYGERNGWYLPDFDDTGWSPVALPDNWTARGQTAPIGWYRTHFQLHTPANERVSIGLTIPSASDKAVIWLNGWLLGRYWQGRGPQHTFYLPDGVLDANGDNVLAIAVWNRGGSGGLASQPSLQEYGASAEHIIDAGPAGAGGGYWHTAGDRIVDEAGRPVRIAAVNWGGMQTATWLPGGLDRQPLDAIVARVAALGFNTIRLPFSNELVERDPVVTNGLTANPELRGLHALQIMDRLVDAAGRQGLRVVLDDHRSNAGVDPQENGLWYTTGYPERAWIDDWKTMVRRYMNNPTVVGVDLRDEPHTGPPGPWSLHTYLTQGATWGPYNGVERRATDWRLAAERGGNAVLRVNPHLLIFVEGIQQYPDSTQRDGIDSYWWGGILGPARRYPVQLRVPHQLVYSPHEYGPQKYAMPFFTPHMSYASMVRVWQQHWAYLLSSPSGPGVPIFIGEFGTCGTAAGCAGAGGQGLQSLWFRYWLRFLQSRPQIGWAFWALNGTNTSGHDQPNYILRSDWASARLHQLVDALRDIELAPPPGP